MTSALKQIEFVMRKQISYNNEKGVESNDEEKIPLASKKGKKKKVEEEDSNPDPPNPPRKKKEGRRPTRRPNLIRR